MKTSGFEMKSSTISKVKKNSGKINGFEKNGMDMHVDAHGDGESGVEVNKTRPKLKLMFKRSFASMENTD